MCAVIERSIIFQRKTLLIALCLYFNTLLVFEMHSGSRNDLKKYFLRYFYTSDSISPRLQQSIDLSIEPHDLTFELYFAQRMFWKTSNIGSILFKMQDYNTFRERDRTFNILVWRYWSWLRNRYFYSFQPNGSFESIFRDCSVRNCFITGDDTEIDTVDVVVVPLMHGVTPTIKNRTKNQIWVFLDDESPRYAFSLRNQGIELTKLNNVFNWSMTYRTMSDVPIPYGRTVPLKRSLHHIVSNDTIASTIPNLCFKRPDVLVAIAVSRCFPFRMKFLNNLRQYINVDVYGKCSDDTVMKDQCPGHFRSDCPALNQYYFYLVIENSMCTQYITEKVFQQAYSKGAIPIIVGHYLRDSEELLPPNSYIHWNNYLSYKALAEKINSTYVNKTEYMSYHLWRNDFEIRNEHGFLGTKSYHLCRLCEALNYNDEQEKMYTTEDLRLFFSASKLCAKIIV